MIKLHGLKSLVVVLSDICKKNRLGTETGGKMVQTEKEPGPTNYHEEIHRNWVREL